MFGHVLEKYLLHFGNKCLNVVTMKTKSEKLLVFVDFVIHFVSMTLVKMGRILFHVLHIISHELTAVRELTTDLGPNKALGLRLYDVYNNWAMCISVFTESGAVNVSLPVSSSKVEHYASTPKNHSSKFQVWGLLVYSVIS